MRFIAGGVLALLVLVSGCGDDGSSSSSGGAGGTGGTGGATSTSTTSVTSSGGSGGGASGSLVEDYCAPLAAFVCGRLLSCGCGALLPSGALDEQACVADYTQRCLDAYAPVASAVAAGQARILKDQASACIALLESSTPGCERPRGAVAQALCPMWFTGAGAIGEACDFPVCDDAKGVCDNGKCVARPGEGEPCAAGGICGEGLLCIAGGCAAPVAAGGVCDIDDACAPPLRCVDGACAALKTVGGACGGDEGCALGLVCEGTACAERADATCSQASPCGNLTLCAAPRKCQEKAGAGAACDEDAACVDGFRCEPVTHVCIENPGAGEPCANNVLCAAGLVCDNDNGNCGPVPGDGQPCGFGAMGPGVCGEGLGCVDNVCGMLPGDGQACTLDSRCAEGLGCDFAANGSVCVPLKDAGGVCQTDRTCKEGLFCDFNNGTCAVVLAAGSPCTNGNECGVAGTCIPGSGGGFECAPLPGVGGACLFDCQAGLHCTADVAASSCAPEVCKEL